MKSRHELSERLQVALEGATYDPADREVVQLVRMATLARELAPAGPGPETTQRLREGFATRMSAPVPPSWLRWLGAWVGSGPAPRPLVERMAAGIMLIGVVGGSTGAAAGVSPMEMASGTVRFVDSVVSNLDPRGTNGGGTPAESPTPTSSPTPTATTPTPTTSPSASATVTPSPTDDHDDDDDDHSNDDSRDRSDNSGRGNSNDDAPEDNPSSNEDNVP